MRWLMITRKLDPTDDRAGFVMRWIEALAERLDYLDVICQEQAYPRLPANVAMHSMGKESGVGRIAQARRVTQLLRQLTPRVDGVFCHMIPRYVLFAAPWTRLNHKPLLLWYTHRQASAELRIAARLASHILTASPGSFPLKTDKLAVMGHGVEMDLFPPPDGEADPPEIVLVARLAHIKRQDWLIRAAAQVSGRDPFRVVIVGGPVEGEPDYPAELRALAQSLDLDVVFTGALPHADAAARLRGCAVAVNLSPAGLFDKAALEGMFAGKPTIVTNTAARHDAGGARHHRRGAAHAGAGGAFARRADGSHRRVDEGGGGAWLKNWCTSPTTVCRRKKRTACRSCRCARRWPMPDTT
jgi:glycosyltransferase involved in cell wall biosynthesis